MMKKNKPIPILVTGLGAAAVGTQIMKALRIAKTPYRIIGTDMSKESTGLQKVDVPYVIPSAKNAKYLSAIMKICKKEKIRCIFPGTEIELLKLSQKKEFFEKKGIFVICNPYKLVNLCLDKGKLFEFLKKNQVKVPDFQVIYDIDEFKKSVVPAIIKPVKGSGSKSVFLGETIEEVKFFIKYLITRGQKVIVQEYVGSGDEEYTVGIIRLNNGKIKRSIALKRDLRKSLSCKEDLKSKVSNKRFQISTGISQGWFDDFTKIRKECEKISDILNVNGPINVQCRKTKGGIIPFEINPRFSGTTYLRSIVGMNEPDIMIKYLLKNQIQPQGKILKKYVSRDLIEEILK